MALPSGLAEVVQGEEYVARFLFSSNSYNAAGVKWTAFDPNPVNGETSVFRSPSEIPESLWDAGRELSRGRVNSLHGAALLQAESVFDAGLRIVPSEPPAAHANINGWPVSANDPAMQKARRIELAKLLAQRATLVVTP